MAGHRRYASLSLLLLVAAAATAAPQLLPLDDDPDIDVRRSYLPPQGYLPPQPVEPQASFQTDVALAAAAAPEESLASPPGAAGGETAEQCSHSFHSFLCGRPGRRRRPGAAPAPAPATAPAATFQEPSRLLPDPSPRTLPPATTPPPLLPNPQFQATFLQPSRLRPPPENALPSPHLNCTSQVTLEIRPQVTPSPPIVRDRKPAPSITSFRQLYAPQKSTIPNEIKKETSDHNCTSETTLKVTSPFGLSPSYSRQPPPSPERISYPPYEERKHVAASHDSTNCSSQTTARPTTTSQPAPPPTPRIFAEPSPQPSATFESSRLASPPNHPPGCTCGADHSAGSSVDATFVNPEKVAAPQRFRTTVRTTTTPTTTTTTTERPTTPRPAPRSLEPLAAAPEPAVVAPPGSSSWSEADSCSHAFHSFLCKRPQAAASSRRKALPTQPIEGDSSFISAASLPAPRKATLAPSEPTRGDLKRQPDTSPTKATSFTTSRAPSPTVALPSRKPPTTQPPATTAKPTTVTSGPVIEPQAAQDAPAVAVPRPNDGASPQDHHHHHHEGRDLCSDPFHSFLCQKVDTSKRRRVYGRLPQPPLLPAGSLPDRARVDGPAFVGDSTFVKAAAVPPPGNFVSPGSLSTLPPRPSFISTISTFTTSPPQQRRKPTPCVREEYSQFPQYSTSSRRLPSTTESETVQTTNPTPPCHSEGRAIPRPTIATLANPLPQFPRYRSEQAASNILTTVSDPYPQNVPYKNPRPQAVENSSPRSDSSYYVGPAASSNTVVASRFFNRIPAAQDRPAPSTVSDSIPQERSRPAASNSQPITSCVKFGGKCLDGAATKSHPSLANAPVQAERISTSRPPLSTTRATAAPGDNDVQPAAAQNDDARVLPQKTDDHGHDHHEHHHHHHHSGNICDDPFHSFLCEPTKPRRRFDGRPQTSGAQRRPPAAAGDTPRSGVQPLEGAGSFLSSATLKLPSTESSRAAKAGSQDRYSHEKPRTAFVEALPAAAQQQEVVGYLYPQPTAPLRYPGESLRSTLLPQQSDLFPTGQSFQAERANDIRSFVKTRSSAGASIKRDTLSAASDSSTDDDRQLSETPLVQSSASESQPTRWSWAQTTA